MSTHRANWLQPHPFFEASLATAMATIQCGRVKHAAAVELADARQFNPFHSGP